MRSALGKLGLALGGGALGLVVTAVAAGTVLARRVVTPAADRPDDVQLLTLDEGQVTMTATDDTLAPGRYGMWQDGGTVHLRVGAITRVDEPAGSVTRTLLATDRGQPHPGPARWNQYYFSGDPRTALDLPFEDVLVPANGQLLPCWLVPGSANASGATWAILVHGRGATREETLRALPVLHRLGVTALVVSYGTTEGLATPVHDRYHLGDLEWQDVEAAILFAAERAAGEIVLIGWSMGAAIALQTVSRSWVGDRVRGLVLDSPALDWRDVLDHQAKINHVPVAVGRLGQSALENPATWRLVGTRQPLNLDRLDWVSRADELDRPVLIIHSDDDEFVPSGPSRELADARSDLVTYLNVPGARHTKMWNVDPDTWDAAVARFILTL